MRSPSSYAIVSCVHGRPELTKAWAKHIATHFFGSVVVAGNDPELKEICELYIGPNLLWVPYANRPLGAKWNRAAERAVYITEHCVILGSDDFPSPELFSIWEYATRWMDQWIRMDSIYFYDIRSHETACLQSEHGFGTGRMYPSSWLRKLFETKGYAWHPAFRSQLDSSLYSNLGCPESKIALPTDESCWLLAVKSDQYIHSYSTLRIAHPRMFTVEPNDGMKEIIQLIHPKLTDVRSFVGEPINHESR